MLTFISSPGDFNKYPKLWIIILGVFWGKFLLETKKGEEYDLYAKEIT